MEILKVKTNINCSGCVAKVTPHLTSAEALKNVMLTQTIQEIY